MHKLSWSYKTMCRWKGDGYRLTEGKDMYLELTRVISQMKSMP